MVHQKKITSPTNQPTPLEFISINNWLEQQADMDLLRFITCGSVDDGKSTLIGRLLWDSQQIFEDQLAVLKTDSKRHGTQGEQVDLALLVDGLAAEREQGITIDVAYRFFSTARRKFIVADTPGHEQYTRNMVTGVSTADLAVILIDARLGILMQTRRHAYLVSLMGIHHIVLAINKMDLVDFDAKVSQSIEAEFNHLTQTLNFKSVTPIPISALTGDNITSRSSHMPWYLGPTLMELLETIDVTRPTDHRFVFPVQWVNRPSSDFRGFSGTIASGHVAVGDPVRITTSGQIAHIKRLVTFDGDLSDAHSGDAVTLVLDKEVDASRGDIIAAANKPLEMSDQFEATLIWMQEEAGLTGSNYEIKLANQWARAAITSIKYGININTLAHESYRQLGINDIAVCDIALHRPLVLDAYEQSPTLGGFILVDRFTQATVAAGLIHHNLRRAQNVHRQALSISRENREQLHGHRGKVIWFTGLPGSGKSTLANTLEQELYNQGKCTYVLDGDNIRQGINKDLGFTDADRVENIRRVAEVARLMMDAGLIVMTAFISPFRAEREMARQLIGEENFIEVYVNTPLEICEQRDPKGLYKKARYGQVPNMTGINSPYEVPLKAEITIQYTDMTDKQAIANILQKIQETSFNY
ncbi:adenylylsulfate kinase /sulfate adenylyltransferase subunit 1 [Xenorhabdus cabanillasii]|uniref:Multifunctional fusion protein n=1 Tax=Xenorhabdus cabanillasii TaxID=351673 RepID=A0A3D9UMW4_9GAMM|nr:sulfate adenylyltransferase subunit CysN [Xenorhabdus cabanillasii]REF27975.1 adenylylsulfate kinase /sulfate adenylyltransferase subunit 1 [Xenorhabdus cabanillasii]